MTLRNCPARGFAALAFGLLLGSVPQHGRVQCVLCADARSRCDRSPRACCRSPPACAADPDPKKAVLEKCTPNSGDTAWMLTSVALVLMMTIPGLGLFYGGMVRKKNVGDTVMTSFAVTCLVDDSVRDLAHTAWRSRAAPPTSAD